ncbi:MAG: hypothetical protein KDC50_06250 [Flavobacterium sp.]|nr:hypothetical protein [Flavobacterium sp.]
MKTKLLHFLLLVTSLLGYLEWSGNSSSFLFEAEAEVLSKLFTNPLAVLHPFTLVPMIGQLILIITLLQKRPRKILAYISISCLAILLGFMLLVGFLSLNYKIILSTLPFFIVSVFTIKHHRNHLNT